MTGADLDGEDADSDLSDPDESASDDSVSAASDEDAEQEDEDDIATAKGNHKRREDKNLLPTEDKCVVLHILLPLHVCLCEGCVFGNDNRA